jgi:pyrroline-5-carboxylate reductase
MTSATAPRSAAPAPAPEVGFIGVGALSSALLQALARAWPEGRFHLSPRSSATSSALAQQYGARRHASNQAVADATTTLVIGVRPAQLAELARELRLTPEHQLLVLAAGTPLARLQALFAPARVTRVMTGLAVASGQSAIALYPAEPAAAALLAPACATLLSVDDEAQLDGVILAVCANAWWLDQLAALSDWMVQATDMPAEQATALLCANLADVATLLRQQPGSAPRDMARAIGTPGTFTAFGLDRLEQLHAHQAWTDTLTQVLARLRARAP